VEITLSSNATEILRQVQGLPARMAQGIARAMDKENQLSIGYAQNRKLTGPRPQILGVVTNRLRNSLTASKATVDGNQISSTIGTNVEYAAIHEYGFQGSVTVRAHQRKVFASHVTGGVSTLDPRTGKIRKSAKKRISLLSSMATVRAHQRLMKMPARPFLSSTLQERELNYGQAVSEAIRLAWEGGRA
jgi:phage gpG-like protein